MEVHEQQELDFDDPNWKPKTRMSNEEMDRIENELKNHPLFLKEAPKDLSSSPELLAIQNLMFEDTPENLANYFNRKGNEQYKAGTEKKYYLKQALKSYTEGIEKNSSDQVTNARLYANRALI